MSQSNLKTNLHAEILEITIDREYCLNALDRSTVQELAECIRNAQTDAAVKGVLITGAGKAFVSGADIKEFVGLDNQQGRALALFGQSAFKIVENSVKPVLAAVNGYALGGGCELAMACHLRVASEQAVFGQPEVKLGIIAGYGGTQRLIQYIGKGKAMELHLTGRKINAREAYELGLVNYVVPHDQLIDKSREILQEIVVNSSKSVEGIIKSINAFYEVNQPGFENEINEFGKCFLTKDAAEGIDAFLHKRKPRFN